MFKIKMGKILTNYNIAIVLRAHHHCHNKKKGYDY